MATLSPILIVIELASYDQRMALSVRSTILRISHSKYNRWEDDQTTLHRSRQLCMCTWLQTDPSNMDRVTSANGSRGVIFQTDSDERDGSCELRSRNESYEHSPPEYVLPTGVQVRDYLMLNLHIESLRATYGVEVLFWKVPSEHLPGAYNQNEIQQSIIHNREMREPADSCGLCTIRQQMQEVMFAKTGNPCCPNRELVQKYGHLKKGDTLPLTNTAGVDAKVMMEVDGSVAAEALKDLNSMILKAHEGSISKGKGGNDACGH